MPDVTIVVPTIGRASLATLLGSLADALERPGTGELDVDVVLVDDRPGQDTGEGAGEHTGEGPGAHTGRGPGGPAGMVPAALADRCRVVRTGGRGPAAARNAGWRATTAEWVTFLDDDVVVEPGWAEALRADLDGTVRDVAVRDGAVRDGAVWDGAGAAPGDPPVAAVQADLSVPLPDDRRPTDWERQVAGLADAAWITADIAYRRDALAAVGGFDERFTRAYREDADLALRLLDRGWVLRRGRRRSTHPVPSAGPFVSVRRQGGNADDPLMRHLHGPRWRERAAAPPGRRPRHLAITAALATALAAAVAGRPRLAAGAGAAWLAGTVEFAVARIAPGPRDPAEVATMLVTSAVIPPVAVGHWLRGVGRVAVLRRSAAGRRVPRRAPGRRGRAGRAAAVLFDRDGTLVVDVPYNGDPGRVRLVPGAREAVRALHAGGVATAVVSNQSGVARGLLTPLEVDAVNQRVDAELGGVGAFHVCPHGPGDDCGCRKPAAGLVAAAAAALGVAPAACVVVGDIGSDVEAARRAGARSVLVPAPVTRYEEILAAPVVADDLTDAVRLVLDGAA